MAEKKLLELWKPWVDALGSWKSGPTSEGLCNHVSVNLQGFIVWLEEVSLERQVRGASIIFAMP